MGDLIKNNKQQRIQQAKATNTRERNIAKQYFNSGPSIGNLARAAYHWWNSVPELGGEDESGNIVIGGEAPTPGMRNPKSIVKGVKPVIKIVKENAAKITPEMDKAYMEAVQKDNRPEALRLLEQAYLSSGVPKSDITITPEGNALGWFHGSEWGNHTIFDSKAMNATIGGASANGKIKGNFLTTDFPSAARYAGTGRWTSKADPKTTVPITFWEKVQNLFGRYKPRTLYPAERVGELAPKPNRLFDTKGKTPIEHLDKTDNVVYPFYVNPGKNIMRLDFQEKPWSQAPVKFPNSYMLERKIHTPEKDWINNYGNPVLEYKTETVPYKTLEEAMQAFTKDPIAKYKPENPLTSLKNQKFDSSDLTRTIEGYNSTPHFETVKLIETYTPSTTNGAVQTAAKEGYNSVLMKNVIDSNGGPNGIHYAIDDLVTLKPEQMKLADITYDDTGKLIPLSKRFNWKLADIRYGLLPIIGGLGSYSVNKKKQGGQIVKKFKRKFQFGGKYIYDWKNSPIKISYGYPVYWSNNVPEEYKWVTDFLKNNPSTTGMAIGGNVTGDWDTGPRVIIRNSNSNILTDPKDPRWNGLDKIEAVRHYMNETNYNPYFKISPEQEFFRKNNFPKDSPYNTDDDAWRQSIISRIIAGDMEGTPEQMKIVDKFKKDFQKQKGFWEKF